VVHGIVWQRFYVCDKVAHHHIAIASYCRPHLDRGNGVRGSLPISTNSDTAMFLRDLDGPDLFCPFIGVWICGHAWELCVYIYTFVRTYINIYIYSYIYIHIYMYIRMRAVTKAKRPVESK